MLYKKRYLNGRKNMPVWDEIRKNVSNSKPIVLYGRSGVGKSLIAKRLHSWLGGEYISSETSKYDLEDIYRICKTTDQKTVFVDSISDMTVSKEKNEKYNYSVAFKSRIVKHIFRICLNRNIKLITVNHVNTCLFPSRDSIASIKGLFGVDMVKIEIKK